LLAHDHCDSLFTVEILSNACAGYFAELFCSTDGVNEAIKLVQKGSKAYLNALRDGDFYENINEIESTEWPEYRNEREHTAVRGVSMEFVALLTNRLLSVIVQLADN